MTVISLRGTHGAGKSHIVREIMSMYDVRKEIRASGRRHPIGYELDSTLIPVRPLFVPGHYETSTSGGGIDNLGSIDEVYSMIWEHYDLGHNILYEGKSMSDGVSRLTQMFDAHQARVIVIILPIEDCVAAVKARAIDRGDRIKQEVIVRMALKILRDVKDFEKLGYSVSRLNRASALEKVRSLLAIEQ